MKRFSYILFCVFLLFAFSNCKKSDSIVNPDFKISTTNINNITAESASIFITIKTSDLGQIVKYGVCWSKSNYPAYTDANTSSSFTSENVSFEIKDLDPNTKYFIRAFCINKKSEVIYGNELAINTQNITLGMSFKGGIFFYQLQTGDLDYDPNKVHGLIISNNNFSNSVQWYNTNSSATFANGVDIGKGLSNTIKIVNSQGSGFYAAKLCEQLVENGYSDWFLPSINELKKISQNKNIISNMNDGFYWSSTEANLTTYATAYDLNKNVSLNFTKNYKFNVRAIRSF